MVQKQIVCYYPSTTLNFNRIQSPINYTTSKPLYATEDLDEVIGFTSANGSYEFSNENVFAPFYCSFYVNELVFLCCYIKKNNDPIIVSTIYNNVGKGEYVAPATIKREILEVKDDNNSIQVRKVTISYEEKD